MKRIAFYITILFLTFVFSVAFTKIYFVWVIQFNSAGVGSMMLCGDGFGGFSQYESYDGEKLNFSSVRFSSEQKARQCYQILLKETIQITERETLFDEKGENFAGKRVVAVFPPNEFVKKDFISIVALDREDIYIITSTSQRHTLTFEKSIRKY